jgi:hypothetical protein
MKKLSLAFALTALASLTFSATPALASGGNDQVFYASCPQNQGGCPQATTLFFNGSLDKTIYNPGDPISLTVYVGSDDNPQLPSGVSPVVYGTVPGGTQSADLFPGTYTQNQIRAEVSATKVIGNAPNTPGNYTVAVSYSAGGYGQVSDTISFTVSAYCLAHYQTSVDTQVWDPVWDETLAPGQSSSPATPQDSKHRLTCQAFGTTCSISGNTGTASYVATCGGAPSVNGGSCSSLSAPATLSVGQSFSGSVTMTNTGNTTWTPGGLYRLGSQYAQDNTTWGTNRVLMSSNAAPNTSYTFTNTFTAPSTPGSYTFGWGMVQDGVQWFGGVCARSIQVAPAEPTYSATCTLQGDGTYNVALTWNSVTGATNYPVRLQGPSHATGDIPGNYPIGVSGGADIVGWGAVGDAPTSSGSPGLTFTGVTTAGTYQYWGHAWSSTGGYSTDTPRNVTCAASTYTLSVNSSGASSVVISSSSGHGGTTNYTKTALATGTSIVLTAPATSGGANFSSWTGCTTSSGTTCNVTMPSAPLTVTANYTNPNYTLTVNSSGSASVVISSSSGHGGTTNYTKASLASGTSVVLTAPATAGGNNFSSWTGCTSSSGTTCNVTMSANTTVTANYTAPATYTLSVNSSGAAGVVVTSSTGHGGTTSYTKNNLSSGTSIVLTAPATSGGANFSSWSNCTSSSGVTCNVTMPSAPLTVTANYTAPATYSLTVNSSGASGVVITSSTGHGGTTSYTKSSLASNTSIVLTAPATSGGANFSSWSNCTSSSGVTCNVTMPSADATVTATYTASAGGASIDVDNTTCTISTAGHGPSDCNITLTWNLGSSGTYVRRQPGGASLMSNPPSPGNAGVGSVLLYPTTYFSINDSADSIIANSRTVTLSCNPPLTWDSTSNTCVSGGAAGSSPDLIISIDAASNPVAPTTSDVATLSATVKNQGGGAVSGTYSNVIQVDADSDHTSVTTILATNTLSNTPQNGTGNISISYTFPLAQTYYIRACADESQLMIGSIDEGSNEGNNCGNWVPVTVTAPPAQPVPTASLTPASSTINPGQSQTLTWSSTNSTSCTFADTGVVGTSGSRSVSPAVTSTYDIYCSGAGGDSSHQQAVVTVITPILSITANPTRVSTGGTTSITANATNVRSCTVTRSPTAVGWPKSGNSNPQRVYAPAAWPDTITSQTTYVLSCRDVNNNPYATTATVTVNISPGFQEF